MKIYSLTMFNSKLLVVKESLSTTVLCALLFLFFPRIQFIARTTVDRTQANHFFSVFYDKAGAFTRDSDAKYGRKYKLKPNRR